MLDYLHDTKSFKRPFQDNVVGLPITFSYGHKVDLREV